MMGILKRLFCRHEWVWVRNIHGDEINLAGGNRSWWRCRKCGRYKLRPELYRDAEPKQAVSVAEDYGTCNDCEKVRLCETAGDFPDGIYCKSFKRRKGAAE